MSLINEALKKAQMQRAADEAAKAGMVPPPGIGGPPVGAGATPPAPPRPPLAPAAGGEPDDEARRGVALAASVARTRRRAAGLGRWAVPGAVGAVLVVLLVVGLWSVGGADDDEGEGTRKVAAANPAEGTPAARRADETDPMTAAALAAPAGVEPGAGQGQNPIVTEAMRVPAVRRAEGPADQPGKAEEAGAPPPATAGDGSGATPAAEELAAPRLAEDPVQRIPARVTGNGLTILTEDEGSESARVAGAGAERPVSADPARVETAMQPREAVLRYLERARVTGVRLSATDPKVLFNDRVYRLNEVVDRDLQLRVIGIADRELTFRDAQGYVYTKSF